MTRTVTWTICVGVGLLGGACSTPMRNCPHCGMPLDSKQPLEAPLNAPQPRMSLGHVYRIAPVHLLERVRSALSSEPLSLPIEQVENGVILTGWREYPGEFHVVRRWQERTRYRISIIPDVSDPVHAARFEITQQTQRRSNDRANWEEAGSRDQRVRELTEMIDAEIRKGGV